MPAVCVGTGKKKNAFSLSFSAARANTCVRSYSGQKRANVRRVGNRWSVPNNGGSHYKSRKLRAKQMTAVGTVNMQKEQKRKRKRGRMRARFSIRSRYTEGKGPLLFFFLNFSSTRFTVRGSFVLTGSAFLRLFRRTQTRVRGNPVPRVIHDSGR